jgi:hypothetical protein
VLHSFTPEKGGIPMQTGRISTIVAAAVIFVVLAEVLLMGGVAAAWTRRFPAIMYVDAGSPLVSISRRTQIVDPLVNRGILQPFGNARFFSCPIPDDDMFPKTRAIEVLISGFQFILTQVST